MRSRKRTVYDRRSRGWAWGAQRTALCGFLLLATSLTTNAQENKEGKAHIPTGSAVAGGQVSAPSAANPMPVSPANNVPQTSTPAPGQSVTNRVQGTTGHSTATAKPVANSHPQRSTPTRTAQQNWHIAQQEKWQRLHAQNLAEQHAQELAHQHAQQLVRQQAQQLAQQHVQELARQHLQQVAQQHAQQVAQQHAQQVAQQHAQQVAQQNAQQVAQQHAQQAATKQIQAAGHSQASTTLPISPASESKIRNPKSNTPATGASEIAQGPLSEARPDVVPPAPATGADRPLDSPISAVGDAWKMLIYLIPMLLLIVGSLHLLRRFQQRTGRLPGPLQASARLAPARHRSIPETAHSGLIGLLMGGLQRPKSAQHSGAIRLVETVPLGGTNLHLVEVHGRMLLLGASGGSVSLLTEFEEQAGIQEDDFRALLRAAAADMDVLDLSEPDLPATTMVTALEEMMQETGDAVTRRARRLRTVSDYEAAEDIHA